MAHSLSGATRIITIVSLVALSALSFTVLYGTPHAVDTLPQDSLFSFNKRDLPHYPRAFRHARAGKEVVPILPSGPLEQTSIPLSASGPSQSLPLSPANTPSLGPQLVSSPGPTSPSSSPSPSPSPPPPSPSFSSSSLPTSSPTSSVTSAALSSASLLSSSSLSSSSTTAPSFRATTIRTTSSTQTPSHFAVVQTTTFDQGGSNTFTGFPTTSTDSTSTTSASPTAGAVSKGFFANKAAVGVTFSIVGIICGLALTVALVAVMKRYRESRAAADDDEFFEKYLSPGSGGHGDNVPEEPAEVGQGPLGGSVTDLNMFPAPSGAYPDRAIHYGQSNPGSGSVLRPGNYGIEYPPEVANATSTRVNQSSNMQGAYAYGETRSPSGSSASHPFADPVNVPRIGAAPMTYPRLVFGRTQEMVATDSYYGPNSAGVGAGGMGFAH